MGSAIAAPPRWRRRKGCPALALPLVVLPWLSLGLCPVRLGAGPAAQRSVEKKKRGGGGRSPPYWRTSSHGLCYAHFYLTYTYCHYLFCKVRALVYCSTFYTLAHTKCVVADFTSLCSSVLCFHPL